MLPKGHVPVAVPGHVPGPLRHRLGRGQPERLHPPTGIGGDVQRSPRGDVDPAPVGGDGRPARLHGRPVHRHDPRAILGGDPVVVLCPDQRRPGGRDQGRVVAGPALARSHGRRLRILSVRMHKDGDRRIVPRPVRRLGRVGEAGVPEERTRRPEKAGHQGRAREGGPEQEDRQERQDRGGRRGTHGLRIAEGHGAPHRVTAPPPQKRKEPAPEHEKEQDQRHIARDPGSALPAAARTRPASSSSRLMRGPQPRTLGP
jgi:hypothetical protein